MSRKTPRVRQRKRLNLNRTKVGQTNYSYYRSRSKDSSASKPLTRPKDSFSLSKITRWLPQIPFFLATGAIIISLLYVLSTDMNPKVVVSNDSPAALARTPKDYQAAGKQLLSSSIMNRVKLFIDTGKFRNDFLAKFPELADVSVSIPIVGRRPVISVQASQPALVITGTSGKSYVINGRGKAVLKAEETSGLDLKSLVSVTDQSGLDIDIGKNVLPKATVDFISMIDAQFKAKNLPLSSINLPTLVGEADAHINGVAYMVKFNLLDDARQQAGTFLAVKAQLDKDKTTPAEYVDVRVPEKAYYK